MRKQSTVVDKEQLQKDMKHMLEGLLFPGLKHNSIFPMYNTKLEINENSAKENTIIEKKSSRTVNTEIFNGAKEGIWWASKDDFISGSKGNGSAQSCEISGIIENSILIERHVITCSAIDKC